MRLALVMWLMPSEDVKHIAQGTYPLPYRFRHCFRRYVEIVLAEAGDRLKQVRPRLGQHAANQRRVRNVVIRRAAPLEARNQIPKRRLRAHDEPLRRE